MKISDIYNRYFGNDYSITSTESVVIIIILSLYSVLYNSDFKNMLNFNNSSQFKKIIKKIRKKPSQWHFWSEQFVKVLKFFLTHATILIFYKITKYLKRVNDSHTLIVGADSNYTIDKITYENRDQNFIGTNDKYATLWKYKKFKEIYIKTNNSQNDILKYIFEFIDTDGKICFYDNQYVETHNLQKFFSKIQHSCYKLRPLEVILKS